MFGALESSGLRSSKAARWGFERDESHDGVYLLVIMVVASAAVN